VRGVRESPAAGSVCSSHSLHALRNLINTCLIRIG
jgi:hypothetical protein